MSGRDGPFIVSQITPRRPAVRESSEVEREWSTPCETVQITASGRRSVVNRPLRASLSTRPNLPPEPVHSTPRTTSRPPKPATNTRSATSMDMALFEEGGGLLDKLLKEMSLLCASMEGREDARSFDERRFGTICDSITNALSQVDTIKKRSMEEKEKHVRREEKEEDEYVTIRVPATNIEFTSDGMANVRLSKDLTRQLRGRWREKETTQETPRQQNRITPQARTNASYPTDEKEQTEDTSSCRAIDALPKATQNRPPVPRRRILANRNIDDRGASAILATRASPRVVQSSPLQSPFIREITDSQDENYERRIQLKKKLHEEYEKRKRNTINGIGED